MTTTMVVRSWQRNPLYFFLAALGMGDCCPRQPVAQNVEAGDDWLPCSHKHRTDECVVQVCVGERKYEAQ